MKVLVLVQSIHKFGYEELIKVQKETWDSIPHPDVTVFYYIPNEEKSGIIDNEIYIKDDTDFKHMFRHLITAFKYVMGMEWDYIFKVDNSSYVNKAELVGLLTNKPRTNLYGGHLFPGMTKDQEGVCLWGEGVAYSRNVVEKLIDMWVLKQRVILGVDDGISGMLLKNQFEWDTTMNIYEYHKDTKPVPSTHVYRCALDSEESIKEKWTFTNLENSVWREGNSDYKFKYEIEAMRDIHKQLTGV